MSFGPKYPRACLSTFSVPLQAQALVTAIIESDQPVVSGYELTFSSLITASSTWSTWKTSGTTAVSTGLAIADPVIVVWDLGDLQSFPKDVAASVAERIRVTIPTETGNPNDRATARTSPTPTPGLSTGAKIGIGVGVAIGVIAISIAAMLLYMRRRRKANSRTQVSSTEYDKPELDGQGLVRQLWRRFTEIDSPTGRQVLDSSVLRAEADGQAEPQELEHKPVHIVSGPPAELDAAELRISNETEKPGVCQQAGERSST